MPSLPAGTFPSTYDNNQYTSLEKNPGTGYLTVSGPGSGSGSTLFDGVDDNLSIPSIVIGTNNYTIEFWIYPTAISNYYHIYDGRGGSSGDAILIQMTNTGTFRFYSVSFRISGSAQISVNTWNHIALERVGNVNTLYVNGTSDGTYNDGGTSYVGPSNSVGRIGSDDAGSSNFFPGYISNFRIVVGSAVYNGNFTVPSSPLTAITNTQILTCQNGTGSITDASSNSHTITANGGAAASTQMPFVSSTTTASLNLIAFDSANSPERFTIGTIYSRLNNGLLARVATRDSHAGFELNVGDSDVAGAGEITPLIAFDSANSVERYTQGTLYHEQVPAPGNNPGILVKMLTRDSLGGGNAATQSAGTAYAMNIGDSSIGNIVGNPARLLREDSANGVGIYNTGTIYGDVQKTALNTLLSTRVPRTNFKGNIGVMADSSGGGVGGVSGGGQITYTEILLNF